MSTLDQRVVQILEQQSQLLTQLATKDNAGDLHTKTPANFSTYTPLHGPGGIWTQAGLSRDVISAYVRPMGIARNLRLLPTVDTDPTFGIMTGFVPGSTTDADYWVGAGEHCDDVAAGYMKSCTLGARFGTLRVDSQTIEMNDVMLRLHRGDFTDLTLHGELLGLTGLNPSDTSPGDVLNVVSASEMVQMGVHSEGLLNRALWQGAVANNQFPGLDAQIATGHVDWLTNDTCPAADSDVKDFAYNNIDGTDGRSIVEYLSMLEFYLNYNARQMGHDPVEWIIAMRPELWQELTAIWPCAYNTTRCVDAMTSAGTNSQTVIDGRDNIMERDAMRSSMTIRINGNSYPVVLDTGIFEHNNINNANLNPAEFASTIYMVPLTIRGGLPVTYRQYLDFRLAQRDIAYARGNLSIWWTDNGAYTWTIEETKWCYKFSLKSTQRVILQAPHLAGRIDAVKYSPLQHLRDPNPTSPYHFDGGVSLRNTAATRYAVWL